MQLTIHRRSIIAVLLCLATARIQAQDADTDTAARQLSNPIASLTSVPLQFNYERGAGLEGEGKRLRLNFQPVVPASIGDDWNLISRTILPVIDQDDIVPGTGQSGIGDITHSFFFSPKALTKSGWTWGVGPVVLLPTASDDQLGTGKWGVGPSVVALKQTAAGWTYGGLFNHVVSIGGDDDRRDVSATFLQPFVAKRIGPGRTLSANLESTYDWKGRAWTVPVNIGASQVAPIGNRLISLQGGVTWYADAPHGAPGWGARFTLTFLYPKR